MEAVDKPASNAMAIAVLNPLIMETPRIRGLSNYRSSV
jgi:hypothetical protein